MKRPNSMRHLDDAIRRLCGGAPQDFMRARTVMANAIVASMLPDGVVKGGSALKMRVFVNSFMNISLCSF